MSHKVAMNSETFLVAWFGVPCESGWGRKATVSKEDDSNDFGWKRWAAGGCVRSAERMEQGFKEFGGSVRRIFC